MFTCELHQLNMYHIKNNVCNWIQDKDEEGREFWIRGNTKEFNASEIQCPSEGHDATKKGKDGISLH